MVIINKANPARVDFVWEILSFLQGRVRRLVLEALEKGPRTPSSIAQSTGEHLSHVSRALRELTDRGLAECMTPDVTKNKIYRITKKGLGALEEIHSMG